MNIGIDLSPLQGPHRMRGIGYVTRHFIQNIPKKYLENTFVFYVDPRASISSDELVSQLELPSGLTYELRNIDAQLNRENKSKAQKLKSALSQLSAFRHGFSHFGNTSQIDAFIQFDQSTPFPRLSSRTKKILIAYDLIPYILETDYLWNYKTARKKGLGRKASVKCAIKRWQYKRHIADNCHYADTILAISETTKRDFINHLNVTADKISVITLGAETYQKNEYVNNEQITISRYRATSFGYMPRPYTLRQSDVFIMFVGGADPRRKLEDLVAAFNQLRSRGIKLQLVLAGDTMKGPDSIPTPAAHLALRTSGYQDDIVFAGFIDDDTRDWLYKNTNALIFPSVYEGFGLPVVEALQYGTNVISYDNSATIEVAGDAPIYAHDVLSLVDAISKCITHSQVAMKQGAKPITWKETSDRILEKI